MVAVRAVSDLLNMEATNEEDYVEGNTPGEEGGDVAGGEEDDEIKAYEAAQKLEEERKARDLRLLQEMQPIYDDLYRNYTYEYNAELSRTIRKRLGFTHDVNLSYNQATFPEMMKVMAQLRRIGFHDHAEGNFVDLGSGVGTMVFAAMLAHDFHTATGVEILTGLHDTACKVSTTWSNNTLQLSQMGPKRDTVVKFKLGDMCYVDWSQGDVVFCNGTCLDTVVLGKVHVLARELKPGAFFIMVTKKLPEDALMWFQFVDTSSMTLNWGSAPVHYYRRNQMPSPNYIPNKIDYVAAIIRRKALPVFDPSRARLIEEKAVDDA